MIELRRVSKVYATRSGPHTVLESIDFTVYPGEVVGILGRNGAGKSTLIRILSGAEQPTYGHVKHGMSVSWPLAFGGAFQGGLTGMDNLRFVCRIYGVDINRTIGFVREFSELGNYIHEPVKTYSSGMRARLAFAISMAIDFDCFLIDEIITVGDRRFHERCRELLFGSKKKTMVIVSHDTHYINEHCTRASVLSNATLQHFDNVAEASQFYQGLG